MNPMQKFLVTLIVIGFAFIVLLSIIQMTILTIHAEIQKRHALRDFIDDSDSDYDPIH